MRTIDSTLYGEVLETHHLTIGDFYFFKNLMIAEIKEGIHLELINTKVLLKIINSFFKNKPFSHISNRINRYSISPLDFANYCKKMNNVVSFSAITYNNHLDEMNVKIEQHFLNKPYYIADTLEEAVKLINNNSNGVLSISA